MEQKGNDDEGILGFLTDDILKELRRGKRLVHTLDDFNIFEIRIYFRKCLLSIINSKFILITNFYHL